MVRPYQTDAILTATGYVVAQRQAAIASKATGRLQYLAVEEGDPVIKGDLIAQLEHDDVDAAHSQALANLKMANATLEQRQAELYEAELHQKRQQDLLAKGLISDSEFEIADARYKSALAAVSAGKAQVEMYRAAVRSAHVDVENTKIRAPFDGTVLSKDADIGEMVAPFAASINSRGAVVTIADMSSLEVEADVSESNIQYVYVGQQCEIILDAFPAVRYAGHVHKIVPTADRAKATVLTKIRFDERDERVLPEMSSKVDFLQTSQKQEQAEPFLGVTKSAVTTRDGREIVLTVRDNTISVSPVKTGKELAGKVEILAGLSLGDIVVSEPLKELTTGSRVTPTHSN
jgi:RND family efflux transporter MFP subunit